MKLAVVGCGAVAEIHHLPAIAACERTEAVALVDRDVDRARRLAARFGVGAATIELDAAAAVADGAVVAVPNDLHAAVTIELLERGLHVLVEKPMALSVVDCDRMIAAAEASGRTLAVGLEFRHFPGLRWTAAALASGLLGPPHRFDLRQGVVPRWPYASEYVLRHERAGGGVLVDFGAHLLDLLLWWFGDVDELAYRDDARGGVEANCELEVTTANGTRGRLEISRSRSLVNTCRIEADRGTIEVGIWDPDPTVLVTPRCGPALRGHAPSPSDARFDFAAAMRRQLEDFALAAQEQGEPAAPGVAGRAVVELIARCYREREPLVYPWETPVGAETT